MDTAQSWIFNSVYTHYDRFYRNRTRVCQWMRRIFIHQKWFFFRKTTCSWLVQMKYISNVPDTLLTSYYAHYVPELRWPHRAIRNNLKRQAQKFFIPSYLIYMYRNVYTCLATVVYFCFARYGEMKNSAGSHVWSSGGVRGGISATARGVYEYMAKMKTVVNQKNT